MGRVVQILFVTLIVGHFNTAQAAIDIQRNFTRDLIIGPTTLLVTPGQALTTVITSNAFGSVNTTQNCELPEVGCTGPAGVAHRTDDLSVAGVTANGSGTAGADAANSALTLLGNGTTPAGLTIIDVLSGDFQQLRFNVAGAALPEFIDVDITFSITASVVDNTSGTPTAFYFPFASGGVEILEAATVDLGAPSVFAAFSAIASTSDGAESLLGATETMAVRPNADYWVRLITQANVTIGSGDVTGIDLDISGFADPTFALNPEFAAANPGIGNMLVIERVSIVPLPASDVLLVPALIGMARVARRRAPGG